MAEDYYSILGVSRDATKEDIKKAYRKLAHKHHPDKEGGDEEQFKRVSEAYSVLGNEKKRAQYDQFGQTFDGAGGGPFGGFGGQGMNFEDMGGFSDIFETFFGGRAGGGTRVRRGDDVSIDVTVSFEESAKGVEKEVSHRIYQTCSACKGNGAKPGTPIVACATCGGQGTVTRSHQTPLGMFSQRTVCRDCHGEGKKPEKPCSTCRGEGRELSSRTLTLTIPAGISDGQTIRVQGKGEAPAYGGIPGDLYVNVHVTSHKELMRDGNDIRFSANISFVDAALGRTIKVPVLEGEEMVVIPPGTQPGDEIRLRGKGFPQLNGSNRGDQVVQIHVRIPKKLSRKQKQLLEEFKKSGKKGLFGLG